ncbi:Eukaryotic aspartyl protease [Phytophthora infestans]|uniref:Eukaryotic aspartyl protease n=1 Tax=Phytophthora infestans TaxID=4787 RepID=A0A833WEZ8_PHYIN|nr:Eukaryotic aspartyl protease [Phytophthora infestans]KAF4135122.1 Eukaryotic aspartyl protease [Phytophthora infestans]
MDRCKRILRYLIVLVLLLTQDFSAASQCHFIRVPLDSDDQLRFTGVVRLGTPPRSVRVIFDTGSSDTWVSSNYAADVGARSASRAFTLGYGGGIVSGLVAHTDLQLRSNPADVILLPVGFVNDHTSVLSGLDAQGVVGLGMEALAQIQSNWSLVGLLAQQSRMKPLAVSLFISSWSQAQPASLLIIGGVDPALLTANATWFSFPVVSNIQSSKTGYGFWALTLQNLSFGNESLPFGGPSRSSGIALLDSGTSVLLLPRHTFDTVIHVLSVRFGTRLLSPPNKKPHIAVCRPCHVHEFPSLAFEFVEFNAMIRRFELHGSDYVRCDHRRRECTAMIDVIDSSEVSDHLDVVILGTVFFRAYYTRFDYSNKQISFACTSDDNVCLGGLQPALDYHGKPYEQYSSVQQPCQLWAGLCAVATALAVFAGLRTLLKTLHADPRIYINNG